MHKSALSVSSHVSHGYVGNRAVVFPLQYHGWNVDAIHTTNFSNHPGYGQFRGQKSSSNSIKTIFKGLRDILDFKSQYDLILVGYCPSEQVMTTIYQELTPLMADKNHSCKPVLVVDPVLGDNGTLYVPEDIVKAHIDFLRLGLVNLTTPNQFELELLTDIKIDSWNSVKKALLVFNEKYKVQNVVISSVLVDDDMFSVGFSTTPEPAMFRIPIAKIGCRFSGCGDVFTSLLANAFFENNCVLTPAVLGPVLSRLNRILTISFEAEKTKLGKTPEVVQDVRLIQSRKVFDADVVFDSDVQYF